MPEGQVLEFTHVTKRFNNVTAVSDLSVRVEPGVVTGFLGPNGAGKTTTLRMLLGQIRPTSGTATIGGASYAELRHPLRTIGAVLEESAYRPRRTAARQLLIAAKANGIPAERVDEVLRLVGLHADADTRIGGYSLGMRQRLSVATALLGDPGALVLDEPANGLDPEGIRWMRLLMRRLADEGRTVLVSSHVLSEIEQVADHVVVLSKGRAVYAGSIEDLADPATGAVVVDAEDRDGLAAALRAAGLSFDVLRSGVTVRDSDAAAVGAVAAAAGIALTTLQQRGPSLEEVFLDLVYGRRADSPRLDKDANPVAHAPHAVEGGAAHSSEGGAAHSVEGGAAHSVEGGAASGEATVPAGDAALAASGVPGAVAGVVAADTADAGVEADRGDADAGAEVSDGTQEGVADAGTAKTDDVSATESSEAVASAAGDLTDSGSPETSNAAEEAHHDEPQATEQADQQAHTDEALSGDAGAEEFASDEVVAGETAAEVTGADVTGAEDTPPAGEQPGEDHAERGSDQEDSSPASDDHADDRVDDDAPTRALSLPGDLWAPRAAQGSPSASDEPSPEVLPLATEAVSLPVTTEPSTFTELITGIPAATGQDDAGDPAEPPTTTSSFQIFSPVLSSEDDDEDSVDDADDPRLAAMRTSLSAAASRFFGGPAPDYPYGDAAKSDEQSDQDAQSDEARTDTVPEGEQPAEDAEQHGAEHEGHQHHGADHEGHQHHEGDRHHD